MNAGDVVLAQSGGLGGPYVAATPAELLAPLASGQIPLLVGANPSPAASPSTILTTSVTLASEGFVAWNSYLSASGVPTYLENGVSAGLTFDPPGGFVWNVYPLGVAGAPQGPGTPTLSLSPAGALTLPRGTLTVARDPASALEVATMQWVGNQTVASFNGRKGVVTLSAADIYGALGICPPDCIATTSSVNAAICAAINDLLRTYPTVWSWMGRVGDVFLTVADMNFAAANNPAFQPPLTIPTPPASAVDGEVVTAAWVTQFVGSTAGYATEAWVINYIATNAVASFNGRTGAVNLTLSDIQGAGGAPINGPAFGGTPTAPTAAPGSSTSQIATTAFVMAAISNATAGVASFNGRTGTVVLTAPDVSGVGGLVNPSPALTGTPTAPTPTAGNSSTQIATTAFVTAAITAAGGVTAFNGRTGSVIMTGTDIVNAGGALVTSPNFLGTPTAPTATAGTDNTQLATTAFVVSAINSIGIGVTSFEGRTGAVTLQANDISAAGGLINPNVALSGVPTAPTATAGTSSTQIATTAFVSAAILAGTVTAFNGRSGAVTLSATDVSGAGGALLASPSFTGVPQAPTAAPGTNTAQLATTQFVTGALATQAANSVTSFNGRQGVVTLTTGDITGAGGAPIASPNFTGVPTVPTATAGTSTTQAASTAFVMAAIAASTAGVTSFNSRTGAVSLQANDVSAVGGALLASPVFTGSPSAPTPLAGDNSTNIATTAFVQSALATAAVQSFNGRTGAVTLSAADVAAAGGPYATTAMLASYLPLTGGTLTGALSGTTLSLSGTLSGPLTVITSSNALNINNSGNTQIMSLQTNGIVYAGLPGGTGNAMGYTWNGGLGVVNVYVNGTFVGGLTPTSSDPRLKTNIAAVSVDPLAVVNQIGLQQFDFLGPWPGASVQHWPVGFMADTLSTQIPLAVNPGDGTTTFDTVNPLPLIAYLVGAVQKLVEMIQQLQGAVGALQQNANQSVTAWQAV